MENVKIQIAVPWILMAVFMSAHGLLLFMEPGIIEDTISGDVY